jgi:hypothetical protein
LTILTEAGTTFPRCAASCWRRRSGRLRSELGVPGIMGGYGLTVTDGVCTEHL